LDTLHHPQPQLWSSLAIFQTVSEGVFCELRELTILGSSHTTKEGPG
jgi:hypothetical protein